MLRAQAAGDNAGSINGYCSLPLSIGLVSQEKRFGTVTAVRQELRSDRQSASPTFPRQQRVPKRQADGLQDRLFRFTFHYI
jgi:hypothetical protein